MNRILDLNEDERAECLKAYCEEFLATARGAGEELYLRIRLKSIGLDRDEIDLAVSDLKRR
jgi:hypothetical protein